VIGGVHPTLVPEEVLEHECFDYAVIGEGEATAAALFQVLASGTNPATVAGIAYRERGLIRRTEPRPLIANLDALPLPSYRGLIDRKAHIPADLGGVITSRGCPYPCLYCASKKLWTRKVRFRSVARVLEEVGGLYREGVRLFRLHDDAFTLKAARVRDFCEGMRSFPDARWSCDTRVDLLDEDLARRMRQAGCYQVNLGIESGSERIRAMVAKRVDVAQARRLVRHLRRYGIRVTAYFMAGFPTETGLELDETLALARTLSPDIPCFSVFTPYPGTGLWDDLREAGRLPEKPDYGMFYHHSAALNFSAMEPEEFASRLKTVRAYEQKQVRAARRRYLLRHPLRFVSDRNIIRKQLTFCFDGALR
jgi:anaerobic magnesium-protoporphyrin IX monomethyl ester cyclase